METSFPSPNSTTRSIIIQETRSSTKGYLAKRVNFSMRDTRFTTHPTGSARHISLTVSSIVKEYLTRRVLFRERNITQQVSFALKAGGVLLEVTGQMRHVMEMHTAKMASLYIQASLRLKGVALAGR